MSRDLRHPVWGVYDEYRTSRLNVKYHCYVLRRLQRLNIALEIVIALAASGSALAAFTIWATPNGRIAWRVLATVAAALAVAKPLLKLDKREQRLHELIAGYRLIEHRLKKLRVTIEERRQYDEELQKKFTRLLDDLATLASRGLDQPTRKRLQRLCQQEVARELPADTFFVPSTEENRNA